MFHWQKGMKRLDLPPARVLHLQRSMNSVQVALEGFPPQEANAYFCIFAADKGLRAAVIMEMLASRSLVFYLNEGEVEGREANRLQREGLDFAESMGFMLADLDLSLLSAEAKADLWNSLPLKTGVKQPPTAVPPPPAAVSPGAPPAKAAPASPAAAAPVVEKPVSVPAEKTQAKPAAAVSAVKATEPARQLEKPAEAGNLMEDLPIPLSMRKREPPSPAEFEARRQRLRENLGRLLASL